MQNSHPIFQTSPSADAKRWQAMCIQLRIELLQYDAPRPPRGQFAYTYRHQELGPLECHMDWEEGDESVGWPAQVTLCEAYLRGARFTDRLTPAEVEAIELAAVKAPREIEETA